VPNVPWFGKRKCVYEPTLEDWRRRIRWIGVIDLGCDEFLARRVLETATRSQCRDRTRNNVSMELQSN